MASTLSSRLSGFLATVLTTAFLILAGIAIYRSTLPYNAEGNYFDGMVNSTETYCCNKTKEKPHL